MRKLTFLDMDTGKAVTRVTGKAVTRVDVAGRFEIRPNVLTGDQQSLFACIHQPIAPLIRNVQNRLRFQWASEEDGTAIRTHLQFRHEFEIKHLGSKGRMKINFVCHRVYKYKARRLMANDG